MLVHKTVLFFAFVLPSVLLFMLFATQGVQATEEIRGNAREVMFAGVEVCLQNAWNDICYADLCTYEPGYLCAEELLDVAVEVAGPVRAMGLLHDIMSSPVFAITTDGHLLSHVIGRTTSRVLGSSGENFLRCPHDFNDGCYHGFFEDMLVKVADPVAAAVSICENMPPETTSDKEKSYCYHGAGHVFLMNENYNLDASIDVCTAIPDRWHAMCLSGVFMENAWPARAWEEKSGNFRKDDPLYPCNALAVDFRSQCYAEHYSYLMHEHTTSFDGLVAICLQAGDYIADCLSGLGLMLQNVQRTNAVFESFGVADRTYMEKVIFLCGAFPDDYKESCYVPLVSALLNFDYPSMHRVITFCGNIEVNHRAGCFRQAGSYLNHLGSEETKQQACVEVPAIYQQDCLDPYARHTEVVISDFEERATTAVNKVMVDDVDKNDHLFTKIKHFFVAFFRHLSVLFARPVFAEDVKDAIEVSDTKYFSAIERCISQQGARVECYASLCEYEPGYLCAERILEAITSEARTGPEMGMQVLEEMVASPLFDLSVGDSAHTLAHVVGRMTAQHIGMDGEAFLRCPSSFDYGCVHGFLEISLANSPSPADAIRKVCENMPEKPSIGRANCYHGSGHGVMMNTSYNLDEALMICDQLPDMYSCWSGVFMENNSGYNRILDLYPEHNSFDEYDLLAPCNVVEEKYRSTCFRLHILYLGNILQYDLDATVVACLSAGEYVDDCVFGFGWHILFENLQDAFLPGTTMNFIEKSIYLCDSFPEQYRGICYSPAINQSTVSYGAERSFEFCRKVEKQYVRDCYREIGRRLDDILLHQDEKSEICMLVPAEYRDDCLFDGVEQQFFNLTSDANAVLKSSVFDLYITQPTLFFSRLMLFFESVFHRLSHLAQDIGRHYVGIIATSQTGRLIAVDQYARPEIRQELEHCLRLSDEQRGTCFALLCEYEPGYLCAEHIVYEVTALRDTDAGIAAIYTIADTSAFTVTEEHVFGQHQLAHIVGRSAAKNHGGGAEIFNTCPRLFDYGCHHGFFETSMQTALSPAEALTAICAPSENTINNDIHNCYHGGGHGIMMHVAYDLDEALAVCDRLGVVAGNCYGGVFMESGKGYIDGRVPEENDRYYQEDDLLAPCRYLDERYRSACYSSHFMYYVQYVTSVSVANLIRICRDAGDDFASCLSGATRLFIEGPQDTVLQASDVHISGDMIEKTVFLCSQLLDGTYSCLSPVFG